MPTKKTGLGSTGGLGRRLQALGLSEVRGQDETRPVFEISTTDIMVNPRQARQVFDEEALASLASSIRRYGIVQPVIVRRREDGKYELIAGERRLRAARQCGLKKIPAIVKDYEAAVATEISLIENIQRENLCAIEEAAAYQTLMDEFNLTQEETADKVGKSRSHVANMVRLLRLPSEIQEMIFARELSMGQARPLLQIEVPELQLQIAQKVKAEGLSVRQTEELVRKLLQTETPAEPRKPVEDAFLEAAQDRMKMNLGAAVSIKFNRRKKAGRIEISFASEEEFERLLALLTQEEKEKQDGRISSFSL